MRLLVTGGAGFIGANLVHRAVVDPAVAQLRVIDDLSTGVATNLDDLDVPLISSSILDPAALDQAMRGCDAVVHLAALPSVPRSIVDPMASHQANATGTLSVLEAARRHDVGYVVVASSSSVYGANPALPKRELDWTRPLSPYGVSKLATEAYALAAQAAYGLPVLALRLFNVYGPRQRHDHPYAAVIPRFIDAALSGRPVVVYGDGRQTRDFTYVDTVCQVLLDAVRDRVAQPGPVNLAFGAPVSVLEVLAQLQALLGTPIEVDYAPARPGDVRHSAADGQLLAQLFPKVHPVPLPDGLHQTLAWTRTNADATPRRS